MNVGSSNEGQDTGLPALAAWGYHSHLALSHFSFSILPQNANQGFAVILNVKNKKIYIFSPGKVKV